MNWKIALTVAFPNMSAEYKIGVEQELLETELRRIGILESPLRLAAFFATVGVESGYMRLTRENLKYSKRQILKVFGVGKHSAAITDAEASKLANNPEALAERVYGLGNPKKADALGNIEPGDGFKYRGLGPFQITGRFQITKLMEDVGVDTVEELLIPRFIFAGAIRYWEGCGDLNELADVGDLRRIRRLVNGGYNAYDEFVALYKKLVDLLTDGVAPEKIEKPDESVSVLQEAMNSVGYSLKTDGRYGPKTSAAVKDFQRRNGLKADGIAGAATWAVLRLRRDGHTPPEAPALPALSPAVQRAALVAPLAIGAGGDTLLKLARELLALNLDSPLLNAALPVMLLVGTALAVWGVMRGQTRAE